MKLLLSYRRVPRSLACLFAALFVLTQAIGFAHAAEYSDDHHDHDGVICVVQAAMSAAAVTEPPAVIDTPAVTPALPASETPFISAACTSSQTRAPPPRAPPATL